MAFLSQAKTLVIDKNQGSEHISAFFDAYVDSSNQFTPIQVLNKAPENTGRSNFGFSKVTHWFKVAVHFKSNNEDEVYFEIKYPHLDTLEYYIFEGDKVINLGILGDDFPFDQREIDYTGFVIPFQHDINTDYTFILKVHTSSDVEVPVYLHHSHSFEKRKFPEYLLFGFYYGILFVMFLYNLIISVTLKDLNYRYYSFSILFTLFFMLSFNGHAYEFIWPNAVTWNEKTVSFFLSLSAIFIVLITQKFLSLKEFHSRLNKVFNGFNVINIILTFYCLLTPNKINGEVVLGLIGIQIPFAIGAGIVSWKNGNSAAKYFVIAWVVYQIGGGLAIAKTLGGVNQNFITEYAVYLGSIFEVILLSFALSYRYGTIRKEKEKAQAEIISMQQKANALLERKVTERTAELNESNEELVITLENLNAQKLLVDEKNEHITDSILYAKQIQNATLPSQQSLDNHFPENFILYKPKDIVSGDFYWMHEVEGKIIFAAIDCTGHGVPGALLTMAAANILNQVVERQGITNPIEILNKLDVTFKQVMRQDEAHDSMDLSVICIDKKENKLLFAGAFSDILCSTTNGFLELQGSKKAIASEGYSEKSFKQSEHKLSEIKDIYLYSDGYKDQFGEKTQKKFLKRAFINLLKKHTDSPKPDLKATLETAFNEWKGMEDQTDDVMVIGLKIS